MENQQPPKSGKDSQPVYIEDEVKQAFLDYAMSVIVARALPDVRDGLKPVQRRIFYSMHELGLAHNRPHKKSATVVGDVLGKYHPHGDMAVYETMVRMAQDFSLRYPLVDGQGNFGSIDGDAPAAYRYTEARLNQLSEELLHDLDKETVPFVPNFDGRLKEPSVLPASIPNLLINGSYGIAVGMATCVPPHNFSEVVDGLIALIKDPDLPIEKLIQIIPGPDFPTGGVIIGKEGLREAYKTGKGRCIIRGRVRFEEGKLGKDKVIISEIPYQVNKTTLIETIARLVREKKIEDVTDMRDESDRDGMRIVLELKRDANQELVMNQLYKYTPLQDTTSIILLVLVDNVPKILNLKQLCEYFLEFRYKTVYKRTQFELKQAEERAHILEGLKIALANLDKIIALIRASRDTETAKQGLMSKFKLSDRQSQAILDMKLARLTSLERHKIEEEYLGLIKEIARLKTLLASRKAIMEMIRTELLDLKKRFGDERRTNIIEGKLEELDIEDLIAEEDMTVILTHRGYIKRMPVSAYRRQTRGGIGRSGVEMTETDYVEGILTASTHDYMMFFTNQGRCYWLKVYAIPEGSYQSKGRPVVNVIQFEPEEKVTSYLAVREFPADQYVFMVTKLGTVKKTSLDAFSNVRQKGIIAISLDKGDELICTFITSGKDEVVLSTKKGQGLKFLEKDVRPMGRGAAGVRGIRVGKGDEVIDAAVPKEGESLLVISELGFGKRIDYKLFPKRRRGGKGVIAFKKLPKSGDLAKVHSAKDGEELIVITRNGTVMRTKTDEIRKQGRASTGVRIITLREGDAVADIAPAE